MLRHSSFTSLREAIRGTKAPPETIEKLELFDVTYYTHEGLEYTGQLVMDRDLVPDVRQVFDLIHRTRFPIAKVIPIAHYGWDDAASMADNNTSSFNWRLIAGTSKPSWHAFGRAIDPNPVQNPFTKAGQENQPKGAVYDPSVPGTLVRGSEVVELFLKLGWRWGANWTDPVDYQHFEKHWE